MRRMRQGRRPRCLVSRSSSAFGAVVVLAQAMAAGCGSESPFERGDASPEQRRAEPVDSPPAAEQRRDDAAVSPSDSVDGRDAGPMTEGCLTETSEEAAELPHAEWVEVRPSNIPTAGDGLFARADIPANAYLGDYIGQYLTEDEVEALPEFESAYLMLLPSYAVGKYDSIAGDTQHYVSKVNFAPARINGRDTNLQNVRWESFCLEPYVRLYSTRDIDADEELYVDYGPSYIYGFMESPRVQEFFLTSIGASAEDGFVFEYSDGA